MIVDMIRDWSTWVAFTSGKLYYAFVSPQFQIPEIWAGFLVTSLCGDKFSYPCHFVDASLAFSLPWHRSLTCPNSLWKAVCTGNNERQCSNARLDSNMAEIHGAEKENENAVFMYRKEDSLGSNFYLFFFQGRFSYISLIPIPIRLFNLPELTIS